MKLKCSEGLLNNNKLGKMKLEARRLKLKLPERKYSKNLKMKRKEEELIRSTQKILETSFIFKNSRSKPELRREKSKKRRRETGWSYWPLKSIRRDLRKREWQRKREWKMNSRGS